MTSRQKRGMCAVLLAALVCAAGCWSVSVRIDIPWPYTQYAENYSRRAFNRISVGDHVEKVEQLLGKPLRTYRGSNIHRKVYRDNAEIDVYYSAIRGKSIITQVVDPNDTLPSQIRPGTDAESVSWDFAEKIRSENVNEQVFWHYSLATDSHDMYQQRTIIFDRTGTIVTEKITGFPWYEMHWFLSWDEFCMWLKWG